jgi:hypothetical protein
MRLGRRFGGRPSIYEHIRAHLADRGLDEAGETLPDEHELEEFDLRWAPGALEGAFTRLGGSEEDEELVAEVHAALVEFADRPGGKSRARVRRAFGRAEPRTHVDGVLARLQSFPPRDLDRLYSEMRAIAVDSGRRQEVKFALAVLGGFGRAEDADLLRTFARHEEFTVYAAIALAHVVEEPVTEWLELCRHVDGWGRVELVELLVREPRADACAYLLREGFRNSIMYGYTAQIVAEHCDLAGALEREPDDALVTGAREILSTLAEDAWGGPAGGLLDYQDGRRAAERLLELLEPADLDDYLAIDSLREFLEDDLSWASEKERSELEEKRAALGWTPEVREQLGGRCRELLQRPSWREQVEADLARAHEELPWQAIQVAGRLGIPVGDFLVRHLERHPDDQGAWFKLVAGANRSELDRALALARRFYDFEELAQGPALELHREGAVFETGEWLLQELGRHPGAGWEILRPALRSPVIRNRHFALRALSHWPEELLTAEVREAIARVAERDPDPDVRDEAARVLRGESIEPSEDE